MHNAMTHWLCFRARTSLARGVTVLAAWLFVAGAAYGQSVSVTKVEAFSPHTAGVYCQGTTCWVTRVRNNGGNVTGSATARLMRGGQAVQTQTITGLASGQSSPTFTYSSPSNTICVARLGADGGCYHCGMSGEGWNDNNVSISIQ